MTNPTPPPGQDPSGVSWTPAPYGQAPPPYGQAPYGALPPYGQAPYGQAPYGSSGQQTCTVHPDRVTALHCTRCGRPACPDCLTPASVGFQCTACVAQGRAVQRPVRTVTGAIQGRRPVVTFTLIAVNLVIFLITALQAKSGTDLSGSWVYRQGGESSYLVASGQVWRLFTSGFLHASVIHIALNMLSLYFVGVALEGLLGRGRFVTVYVLSLLGGSACAMLLSSPLAFGVGASGAIFGVLGGLVVVFKRYRFDLRQLILVLAINIYASFQISGVSWEAHLGGLVVGLAVTAAMVYPKPAIARNVLIGTVIAVLVVVVAIVVIKDAQIGSVFCGISSDGYYTSCSG
ncbi:Membrane associated serine protease, rhomboid family [Nakamurella panacisegetis]|uniref:Membrane associated serine protease, rhomboid family n=1 Tax=Nakamurella panacisegetis TaxID=1090615 RepID=A0A1H0KQR8_9ACTN|nr:rhomboid family intramembrane serine protease [Nakamurella panacisegetis]SDO58308.1 Membrane associated serine protease, rhomboid family [Nakamurella panacisegetis]